MSRKKGRRYSDVESIRPSRPTVAHPNWKRRHKARAAEAIGSIRDAGIAFAKHGGWLRVLNSGQHWQIIYGAGPIRIIEWWPSTAKMVVDTDWKHGVHVHRWQDVLKFSIRRRRLA